MSKQPNMLKRWLAVVLVLATALIGSATALADSGTIALTNEATQAGTILGSPSGAFAMYEIAYPGDGAELVIEASYWPSDPLIAQAFGVNIYGYNGFNGRAEPTSDGTPGALAFSYSADDATTLVVQVYSYCETPVSYSIVASGLPNVAESAAVAAATVTEEAAAVTTTTSEAAEPEAEALAGTSAGNSGGGIQLVEFAYAGDDEDVTIDMTFWPDEPSYSKAIGFIVYDPYGRAVATGEPTDEVAFRTASFSSSLAGTYCIQIYNYVDGLTITYSLDISD